MLSSSGRGVKVSEDRHLIIVHNHTTHHWMRYVIAKKGWLLRWWSPGGFDLYGVGWAYHGNIMSGVFRDNVALIGGFFKRYLCINQILGGE